MERDRDSLSESTLLSAHELYRTYGVAGASQVVAVRGVDMTIDEHGLYAIVGRSGSGKSTLLHLLGGLERPSSGHVRYLGRDLSTMSDGQLAKMRRSAFGYVFQRFNLIPTLSGYSNILLPAKLAGGHVAKSVLDEVLDWLQLDTRLLSRKPDEMSGGQQQRVAFARALAHRPKVIFADEPTGSLDTEAAHAAFMLLRRAVDDLHTTVIMVTHDSELAASADQVFQMQDGQIVS